MKRILIAAMLVLGLAACDNNTATIPTAYQEGVQPIDSEFPDNSLDAGGLDWAHEAVEETDHSFDEYDDSDSGFDWGDAAIGFVAAEVIDDVFDSSSSKTTTKTVYVPVSDTKSTQPKAVTTSTKSVAPTTKKVVKPKAKTKQSKPKAKKKKKKKSKSKPPKKKKKKKKKR
ncbi:hypothetical protein VPHD490_0188 [Vibrio phage D490]